MNQPVKMKLTGTTVKRVFDPAAARGDFPVLARPVYGKPLVFLDTAASAQKPQAVIDAVSHAYAGDYANIHRGVYYLSQKSTEAYDAARAKVSAFLGAREPAEIIFTRNATEAINLVAYSYGRGFLKAGDEIVISEMEHHANIVPWQMLRDAIDVKLVVVPFTEAGELDMEDYKAALSDRVKLVAMTHMSNALGTITPIKEIVALAHAVGAKVLVDGCQMVPHEPVDVSDIDADFYVFSGHKLYGPTGIGVLYGKRELLNAMPPYQTGGDMIRTVTFAKTTFAEVPAKFEAGTPHIAGAIGLGAAVDYLSQFDLREIHAHEMALAEYAREQLQAINRVRIYGTAAHRGSLVSFGLEGAHPHDIGTILDREGIAVRGGHHCAQPVMEHFGISGTVRASFGLYNSKADADALIAGIHKVMEIFS
jgi:cysteine desulfurase / selenocysteine lyase